MEQPSSQPLPVPTVQLSKNVYVGEARAASGLRHRLRERARRVQRRHGLPHAVRGRHTYRLSRKTNADN